ncbi:ectonucleotide pyrophosphatase/phosphodiesterase [Luteimonas vadosa]|uniref:alkaline phosphatase family protein n=1 Tax=Luteimonas vadosa TaxID=1165507 RepID=UPI0031E5FC3B
MKPSPKPDRWRFAGGLLACLLAACAQAPRVPGGDAMPMATAAPPPSTLRSVVLVSLDGFRAGDVRADLAPNLARLATEGVHADWMTPSYPTLTFPNHYTLVTGLRPDRHGVVHNTMRDDALGRFRTEDRAAVGDGRWWGGVPIWVTAERAGLPTATLSWPGSEAAIDGVRPGRWHLFDADRPMDARVDAVLDWLGEPPATRPRFVTLYFEAIDVASHAHGPDSPQARAAVREVDAMLGRLVDGLGRLGLWQATDLVIVSDHGMATVPPGQAIAVEDLVPAEVATVVTTGQSVGFEPRPGREADAARHLLGRHPHHACWRKSDLPPRWRYGSHPRVPAIVCQMDVGWDAIRRETLARRPTDHDRGSHGFDPADPSMRTLFVAHGPSFRRGVRLAPFDNVDVYPLLARLLGVDPEPNDGAARTWGPALATEPSPGPAPSRSVD